MPNRHFLRSDIFTFVMVYSFYFRLFPNELYTIGINQFAVHGSLDNCREGFLEGLAENGIVEGKNLTVLEENAQADPGLAAQISTNFAGQKVDLICAIATPSAQSAYSVGRKVGLP